MGGGAQLRVRMHQTYFTGQAEYCKISYNNVTFSCMNGLEYVNY